MPDHTDARRLRIASEIDRIEWIPSSKDRVRLTSLVEVTVRPGQSIEWQDLFVIVDDGAIPRARYAAIEDAMHQRLKLFPQGIACLVILPPGAKPPPDDVKRAVKDLLVRMDSSLSCLGYLVEGTGFKGVAARATLISMKIFASKTYPVYVETSMTDVLSRILPHLTVGKTVTGDVNVIANAIADSRAAWVTPPPPTSGPSHAMSK